MIGDNWWILLMNSMLFVLRFVSSVVRLFVCLSMGFDVWCRFMFILCVMMCVSVVLLRFGGLNSSMWLSGLEWCFVVLMKILSWLCIFFWLM